MNKTLVRSGYKKRRSETASVEAGIKGSMKMEAQEKQGMRMINCHRDDRTGARRKKKLGGKSNWYKAMKKQEEKS